MLPLGEKIAVMTSGISGIRARMAEVFVADGAKVVIVRRPQFSKRTSNGQACRAAPLTCLVDSWSESLGCTTILEIGLAERIRRSCFLNANAMEHCDGGRHHRDYQCRPGTGM